MNNIDFKKLGDYVKIKTGNLDANASSEDGEYPFFTCSIEPLKISSYSYDCECCLVAGNGDLNVKYYNGKFDAYQRTYIIESLDKEKLDVMYLYFFLSSYIEVLRKQSIGGVIKYIKLGNLTDALIPIPELSKQKEICQNLIKAKKILSSNENLLSKYDTLIKSRFIEMFGDPRINSKNLPSVKFIDVIKLQRGFDLPVQERDSTGKINVYGSNGVLGKHNEIKVKGPGIVTGRSGTLGKVYYVLEDFWPLNTTLFSVDTHGNNVIYLKYLLEAFELERFTEGAGVPTLNRNIVHEKEIINAPLELQQQFASFVLQIDKSKFAVQKSLEKAETLYKSLMQEYFG